MSENSCKNYPLKSTCSSFYPTSSQNPKDIKFAVDKEKHQILTFEKLEPGNILRFGWKLKMINGFIEMVEINFSLNDQSSNCCRCTCNKELRYMKMHNKYNDQFTMVTNPVKVLVGLGYYGQCCESASMLTSRVFNWLYTHYLGLIFLENVWRI